MKITEYSGTRIATEGLQWDEQGIRVSESEVTIEMGLASNS